MTGGCPQRVDVGVYLLNRLEAAESDRFIRHLAGCPTCRADVDELAPVVALLAAILHPTRSPGPSRAGTPTRSPTTGPPRFPHRGTDRGNGQLS